MSEERSNFLKKVVILTTCLSKKGVALIIGKLRGRVVQRIDNLPTLGVHDHVSELSSRKSQALVSFQSCITVSTEIPRAAAVSSTVRPPKKRSSTTALLPASTDASSFRASFTAKSSDPTAAETVALSSNSICGK